MDFLFLLLPALFFRHAAGHAYVYWPTSREAITPGMKGSWGYNGPKFGELLKSKHGAGPGGAGGPPSAGAFSKFLCNALPQGPPVTTYTSGGTVTVAVPVNGEHGGAHDFRLCAKDWGSLGSDLDKAKCLDEYLLYRTCTPDGCGCKSDKCRGSNKDPNGPIIQRAKAAGAGELPARATEQGLHEYVFKLPAGVSCEKCTMQWFWHTAWGEQFGGCSDITITGDTPTKPPGGTPRRRSPSRRRESPSRRRSPPQPRRRSSRRRRSTRRRSSRRRSSRRRSPSRRRRASRSRSTRRRSSSVAGTDQTASTGYTPSISSEPVNQYLGCYSHQQDAAGPITELHDKACEPPPASGKPSYSGPVPCRGGLPFFRKVVEPSAAVNECYKFCTSRGLDLFGLVSERSECRCGASIENQDFWGGHQAKAKEHGLLLTTKPLGMEEGDDCKGVEVFQYVKWKEKIHASGLASEMTEKPPSSDIDYMHHIMGIEGRSFWKSLFR